GGGVRISWGGEMGRMGPKDPAGFSAAPPSRLLRIGSFSRRAQLSLHQLRHYHELGLLLPASVDPESGYRYYSEAQTATAQVIAILRSVDMPLAEIRDLLRDPDEGRVRASLDAHLARLERRLAGARDMLARLRELMKEGLTMPDDRAAGELVDVTVDAVRMHQPTGQHVLLLGERAGRRFLPLWVGPTEATAVAAWLGGMAPARPLTHDLLSAVLQRSGATVERVAITRREDEEFYRATIRARWQAEPVDIDARPSDAINIAVRAGAPILVDRAVMEEHAVDKSEQAGKPEPRGILAMAVDAQTGRKLGRVTLPALPGAGEAIDVPVPARWQVVSVEPAAGSEPPRVLVRPPAGG
ncbi:MAG TPA: bifunctional nuclease domain-containing protein, partial [Candidatus Dormibacteraeota bacterium]|nr:bifunctional nuclease domain-containing protein [Candidatus Dormibacteraeota bacterium]